MREHQPWLASSDRSHRRHCNQILAHQAVVETPGVARRLSGTDVNSIRATDLCCSERIVRRMLDCGIWRWCRRRALSQAARHLGFGLRAPPSILLTRLQLRKKKKFADKICLPYWPPRTSSFQPNPPPRWSCSGCKDRRAKWTF